MSAVRKELQSLLKACRMLMRSILTVSRDDDVPGSWLQRVRTAKQHVQEATVSLNLGTAGSEESMESLDRIAATLTTRLVQDLMGEVDRDRTPVVVAKQSGRHDRDGFHGYTWAIELPDLMGFLQMQQKSGVLRVNTGKEVISLIFDAGDLIHAGSDNSPPGSRLGEILVEQRAIERESLERFLVRYSNSPERFGDTLSKEGLISKESLRFALDNQVARIFERLFASKSSYYSFREGHAEASAPVRRNVFQLLLEASRTVDEIQGDESGTRAA